MIPVYVTVHMITAPDSLGHTRLPITTKRVDLAPADIPTADVLGTDPDAPAIATHKATDAAAPWVADMGRRALTAAGVTPSTQDAYEVRASIRGAKTIWADGLTL